MCIGYNETYNDPLDFEILDDDHLIARFKNMTNPPRELYLQEGARVMSLNNKLFGENICNGTIGVVTTVSDRENVEVTFPTLTSISKIIVQKETCYFEINGKRASRKQFPLQNAFALTVHKTQGLTLLHIMLNVDESMFVEGQVYVAMSRVPSLENPRILDFDYRQLKISSAALEEYRTVSVEGLQKMTT